MTSLLQRLHEPTAGGEMPPAIPEKEKWGFRARMTDHLAVAVGTTQGLFILSDGVPDGPLFKGMSVGAFLQSGRRYYAAVSDPILGPCLRMSDDDGRTWTEPSALLLVLPAGGEAITRISQIQPDRSLPAGGGDKAPVLFGVEPAAVFRSVDGQAFDLLQGLWDHPDRESWQAGPGAGGVHTILTHPDRPGRIIVAVANGGVYRSDDAGETWARQTVEAGPVHNQRVHKLAFDATSPDCLFAQADSGTYGSADAGDTWRRLGHGSEPSGLVSDFGFPVVGHPVEPGTAFVFPLESVSYPCSPGGRPRVYRTTDGGERWGVLGNGLPYENAHVTVLSEAFTVGVLPPYALVLGTQGGEIFASLDRGERWRKVASDLPPILCVRILD